MHSGIEGIIAPCLHEFMFSYLGAGESFIIMDFDKRSIIALIAFTDNLLDSGDGNDVSAVVSKAILKERMGELDSAILDLSDKWDQYDGVDEFDRAIGQLVYKHAIKHANDPDADILEFRVAKTVLSRFANDPDILIILEDIEKRIKMGIKQ